MAHLKIRAMASAGRRRHSIARRVRLAGATKESTAAGIYGVIVSAAVMASSHAGSATALVVAVAVTLIVYWSAERYARLVAERIHEGHRPAWRQVGQQLTTGWEIVTASALPVAVLVVLRLMGIDLYVAVIWALVCSTLLLCLAGWDVGRRGQLTGPERLASAAATGMFGVVMILLKVVLH
ncbi:hypothetical protein [Dactylosporangium fulvum]|uniref:Integral membrane protein n=1 Tax=Dactylosporangium fulvum TaxID=53359 RepID=A0ABY5W8Y9_9ACTN|nr:hypothetical protein [Dactylosporangium fulvum]UWP85684.1 hypothetical protein Dfulv_16155 [Dactylosporangium fulvum]